MKGWGRKQLLMKDVNYDNMRLCFHHFLTLWSIIDWGPQMPLFQNLLGFALRPHFLWAALCFWQSPLSQELPDGVSELSFVNLRHVCPAFSHSLPQGLTCLTVWCSSNLFWLLSYCLLQGHFPHTVPAHSFLASSPWKTQTDTEVYITLLSLTKKTHTQTCTPHLPQRSILINFSLRLLWIKRGTEQPRICRENCCRDCDAWGTVKWGLTREPGSLDSVSLGT